MAGIWSVAYVEPEPTKTFRVLRAAANSRTNRSSHIIGTTSATWASSDVGRMECMHSAVSAATILTLASHVRNTLLCQMGRDVLSRMNRRCHIIGKQAALWVSMAVMPMELTCIAASAAGETIGTYRVLPSSSVSSTTSRLCHTSGTRIAKMVCLDVRQMECILSADSAQLAPSRIYLAQKMWHLRPMCALGLCVVSQRFLTSGTGHAKWVCSDAGPMDFMPSVVFVAPVFIVR